MYARCPNCQTIFEVSDDMLNVRVGMVRCGICRVAFNALWNLLDQLPGVDRLVAPPPAAEPDVTHTDAPIVDDESREAQPEPVMPEEATESVEPEPAATPSPVNVQALERVDGAIELESIVNEVEQIDDALPSNQETNQGIDYQQTRDVDLTNKEYEMMIPDDEIVLETPADAWQRLGPDEGPRPSVREDERISSSVNRMHAMLNPVAEANTDTEERDNAVPEAEPSAVKQRKSGRTDLPLEMQPSHVSGLGVAAGTVERSTVSKMYSGSEAGAPATESESSTNAWRWIAWSVGIVILLLTILWQIREYYLGDLAQVAAIRPVLSEFCRIAACEVPPRRDSGLIDLVGTNVETHPAVPGALRVVVSLINRAEYSQLPPQLEVTLSDRTGRVVGRRTYTPTDYDASTADAILKPNVVSNVTIDLASPADSAVGYEIQLIPD